MDIKHHLNIALWKLNSNEIFSKNWWITIQDGVSHPPDTLKNKSILDEQDYEVLTDCMNCTEVSRLTIEIQITDTFTNIRYL